MGFPGRATSWATILVLVLLTGGAAAGSIASVPTGSGTVGPRPNYSHGSLSASSTSVPTSTIPAISSTTTTAGIPPGTAPCAAGDFAAQGGRQGGGAEGVAEGTVILTNESGEPCVLSDNPSVSLSRSDGSSLDVQAASPRNPALPPVLVQPSDSAVLIVEWANWCGSPPGPLQIQVTFAENGGNVTGSFDGPPNYNFVPACTNSTQPSTLAVVDAYYAGSSFFGRSP